MTTVISQIPSYAKNYRTIVNTMWLYPQTDLEKALATTTYKYTFDGTFIICPDMYNLRGLYSDIFAQTAISQPIGNTGFSLGVGTYLENFGKEIVFQVPNGTTVIKWKLVKQITPQTVDYISNPGNSPDDTVGYITVFDCAYQVGGDPVLDPPYVVLV